MSTPYTSYVNADAPSNAQVGTTSSVIVAANTRRKGLILGNVSTGTIYLGINNTATLNAGIFLAAGTGMFNMDDYLFTTEAITAISHAAASIITIQEFN